MATNNIVFVNLRAEMGRQQLTIEQMAKVMDMNRDTLSRKLRGVSPISIDEAFRLRNNFFDDMSLDYLFGEKD